MYKRLTGTRQVPVSRFLYNGHRLRIKKGVKTAPVRLILGVGYFVENRMHAY